MATVLQPLSANGNNRGRPSLLPTRRVRQPLGPNNFQKCVSQLRTSTFYSVQIAGSWPAAQSALHVRPVPPAKRRGRKPATVELRPANGDQRTATGALKMISKNECIKHLLAQSCLLITSFPCRYGTSPP